MHTEKEIKEAIGYFNGLENRLFNENAEKPAYNNGFEGGDKSALQVLWFKISSR